MTFCGSSAGFLIAVLIVACATASPFWNKKSGLEASQDLLSSRVKRPQILNECMTVGLEEDTYFYKSRGQEEVCGLYLVASPEQRIEVTLESLKSNCETGLVSLLDGWEMGGEVFPPPEDSPMDDRVSDFCGNIQKKLFVTASNAATILYKLPTIGDKFKISVRFLRHPKPCNILLIGDPAIVTLRNYGQRRNCSVATANPSIFRVLQIAVGTDTRDTLHSLSHQKSLMCSREDHADWVEIGGTSGLNTHNLLRDQKLCGFNPKPRLPWARVWCDVTAVRLVSSGYFENLVTVAVNPLTDLEIFPSTICEATE